MISAIVLAAGSSSRMGTPKLVLQVDGTTVLQRVLAAVRGSSVDETVVVLGEDAELIKKRIKFAGEKVVVNREYARGMSSSIREGVRSVSPNADAVLIVLGDQPFLSSSTIDRVVRGYLSKKAPIVVPVLGGVRGNPVLFAKRVLPEVARVRGDKGARSVVERYGDRVLEISVHDQGVLFDIDTPSDYQRAASHSARGRRTREGA